MEGLNDKERQDGKEVYREMAYYWNGVLDKFVGKAGPWLKKISYMEDYISTIVTIHGSLQK